MSASAEFERGIAHPLETVHAAATSEEYLLTVDDSSTSTFVVQDAEREVRDDGSVWARIVAVNEKEDGTTGLSMEQTVDVTPVVDDGFTSTTVTPLPKGMGTVTVVMVFVRDGDAQVRVNAEVIAEVGIPLLGKKIAKKLIESAESTVDGGVGRLTRIAGGE